MKKHYVNPLILILIVLIIGGCVLTNNLLNKNTLPVEITAPLLLNLNFDDLKDSSDYNNVLENNGATLINSTIIFDGKSYIKVDKDFNNNQNLSIAFWINPTKMQNGFVLANGPTDNVPTLSIYFDSFKRLKFSRGKESVYTEPNTILFNTWSYVIITNNGELTKFYVNGQKIDEVQQFVKYNENQTETYIGKGYECSSIHLTFRCADLFFYGKLDDLKIYNKILEDTEIKQLYNENKKL
ncbi:MAG: LamG domain-containing protein [Candidatus Nanoarchaeia archaeon]|nr:LamG domain-containing protein [Candidatus Nanoarchaeia archaeon]